VAAFMCREQIIRTFLKNGASVATRNHRRESPIDVVTGEWSKELSDLYQFLNSIANLSLNLEDIQKQRPKIASILRAHLEKK